MKEFNDYELYERIKKADPALQKNYQLGETVLTKAAEPKEKSTSHLTHFPLLAGAASILIVAVGLTVVNLPSNDPQIIISLNADSGRAAQANSSDSAELGMEDRAMLLFPYYNYTYVAGDELSKESGFGNAYRFELNGDPKDKLNTLAEAFGLTDRKITQDPYAYDSNNYVIGDYINYETPLINLYWSGLGSWYFSNPAAYQQAVIDDECILPGYEIEGSVSEGNGESSEDQQVRKIDTYLCNPTPPADLPTREEALDKASQIFNSLGVTIGKQDLKINIDEWSVYVYGNQKVEGRDVSLDFTIAWAGAEIASASGILATPVLAGEVKLISAYDAVSRVQDWVWWGSYPNSRDYLAEPAQARTESSLNGSMSDVEGSNFQTGAESSASSLNGSDDLREPNNGDASGGNPSKSVRGEEVEIEERTIIFNNSTQRLLLIWDSAGVPWLLPGYVFTSDSPDYIGEAPVVAVDKRSINLEN